MSSSWNFMVFPWYLKPSLEVSRVHNPLPSRIITFSRIWNPCINPYVLDTASGETRNQLSTQNQPVLGPSILFAGSEGTAASAPGCDRTVDGDVWRVRCGVWKWGENRRKPRMAINLWEASPTKSDRQISGILPVAVAMVWPNIFASFVTSHRLWWFMTCSCLTQYPERIDMVVAQKSAGIPRCMVSETGSATCQLPEWIEWIEW
jgi:hypothetical protein